MQCALLVFDTYEAISGDSQKWIETRLLPRTDPSGALRIVIAGQNERGKHAWVNSAEHALLQPIREGSDWHEYTQRKGIQISLEEAGFLALAAQGRPGVIYPLLETSCADVRQLDRADEHYSSHFKVTRSAR